MPYQQQQNDRTNMTLAIKAESTWEDSTSIHDKKKALTKVNVERACLNRIKAIYDRLIPKINFIIKSWKRSCLILEKRQGCTFSLLFNMDLEC